MVNVIENAIKYSGGEGTVEIDITFAEGKVVIAIQNRGVRIDPDEFDKIFIPFYRGKAIAQSVRGQGLGLPIARRIAELHGGALTVSSIDDATVFTMVLAGSNDAQP